MSVVLFLVFMLFISGVIQARSQRLLFQRFSAALPTGQLGALDQSVPLGSPVALLVIPSISVSQVVIEGSTSSDLMQGPGHVPSTPLPGEFGNSIVLGRHLAYGGPCRSLTTLKPGAAKGDYEVTLQIAKDAKPGDVDGTVTIFTNDKINPVVTVPMKATIKSATPAASASK